MKYTHILWDWNGTLVDDVQCAVDCVNDTLIGYGLPTTDLDEYLETIEPSLENYYGKFIDLNVHPMFEVLTSFQKGYAKRLPDLKLMNGAIEVLDTLKNNGAKQYVVSSFEGEALKSHVDMFNITDYFESVSGASDIMCGSKTDRAKCIVDSDKNGRFVFIGDSFSDYHTAMGAKIDCILIAKGHQSLKDLQKCKPQDGLSVYVVEDILDAQKIITQ